MLRTGITRRAGAAAPVMPEIWGGAVFPSHRPDDMRIDDASPPSRRKRGPQVANGPDSDGWYAVLAGFPGATKQQVTTRAMCVIVRHSSLLSLPPKPDARRVSAAISHPRHAGNRSDNARRRNDAAAQRRSASKRLSIVVAVRTSLPLRLLLSPQAHLPAPGERPGPARRRAKPSPCDYFPARVPRAPRGRFALK